MKNTIFLSLLMAVLSSTAQVSDDFSDGDFNINPLWIGDSESFRINADHQMQLFTSGTGTAVLLTVNHLIDSTEWQFTIKLGFSPSSNNFARIYLVSDKQDLTGMLNGYYLQFGESGAGDAPELFRQEGLTSHSICRGSDGSIAEAFSLKFKVTHQNNGSWNLFSAPESSGVYQWVGSGSDVSGLNPLYFGILCSFTSSNSQKFYFDDFLIRAMIRDTIPPSVEHLYPVSPIKLEISFSESITEYDASQPAHYSILSNGNIPNSASADLLDPSRVSLIFSSSFDNGASENLSITGIHDLAGNLMQDTVISFAYYLPQIFDVLINEIMADPDPSSQLPPVEYIELYNSASHPVLLKGWSIYIAGSPKIFPEISIDAKSYLLVTKSDDLDEFGPCLTLLTSSYSLSNEGTSVALVNPLQQLIHSVTYTDEWYRDDWKKEGGWSLEMTDPLNPCAEEGNWEASTDPAGGTPGRVNSGVTENRDTILPRLARIGVEADDRIRIWFSEKMDSTALLNPMIYRIDPSIGSPVETASTGDFYQSVRVWIPFPLEESVPYQIELSDSLADCTGNRMAAGAWLPVGIPSTAGNMDIVINEILLDPFGQGADFIEIYNRTDRFFDLKDLVLARQDTTSLLLVSVQTLCEESFLLGPERFKVLSPDPAGIIRQYHCPDPDAFVKMTGWPAFSQEASVIVLANKHDEEVIDRVFYKESLHFDLISNPEGVSLERIHFDRSSDDPANWHSASQSSGFATPGYQNSQFMNDVARSDQWLTVEPELFTPDNDGWDDILAIYCSESEPGYVANVQVFDAKGKRVIYLVDNALMGMDNVYTWDGKNQAGSVVQSGIYIIFAQVFNLYGNVKAGKRACVLVNQNGR